MSFNLNSTPSSSVQHTPIPSANGTPSSTPVLPGTPSTRHGMQLRKRKSLPHSEDDDASSEAGTPGSGYKSPYVFGKRIHKKPRTSLNQSASTSGANTPGGLSSGLSFSLASTSISNPDASSSTPLEDEKDLEPTPGNTAAMIVKSRFDSFVYKHRDIFFALLPAPGEEGGGVAGTKGGRSKGNYVSHVVEVREEQEKMLKEAERLEGKREDDGREIAKGKERSDKVDEDKNSDAGSDAATDPEVFHDAKMELDDAGANSPGQKHGGGTKQVENEHGGTTKINGNVQVNDHASTKNINGKDIPASNPLAQNQNAPSSACSLVPFVHLPHPSHVGSYLPTPTNTTTTSNGTPVKNKNTATATNNTPTPQRTRSIKLKLPNGSNANFNDTKGKGKEQAGEEKEEDNRPRYRLKDYQLLGVSFLAYMAGNGVGAVLGDEMGLGKTAQTLALLGHIYPPDEINSNLHARPGIKPVPDSNPLASQTPNSNQQPTYPLPSLTHLADHPSLIVCPLSVLSTWISEVTRWLPYLAVSTANPQTSFGPGASGTGAERGDTLRFHGPLPERERLKKILLQREKEGRPFKIVVTTYECYSSEHAYFKSRRWSVVVLDEGHRIKRHNLKLSKDLQGIGGGSLGRAVVKKGQGTGATWRLILTGTPLQNDLAELWGLLHWLYPQIFKLATLNKFEKSFSLSTGHFSPEFLNSARRLLEIIMLRRTKKLLGNNATPDGPAELQVPPRIETTLAVPLSAYQRFWYLRILNRMDKVKLETIFQGVTEKEKEVEEMAKLALQAEAEAKKEKTKVLSQWQALMNVLMQLRKVCNHPYILPNSEPEPFEIAEHIVGASSKLVLLDKLLSSLLTQDPDRKILIFSGFTKMLDLVEDFMALRGHKYARLDGSTPRPRRNLDIRLFQQKTNSPYRVYLISTRAGGLGISLFAADTVVMLDQDWNPQVDIQAIARSHRIGQTKVVNVYKFVCQDTVEEQMQRRLQKKLYLSAKVMESMREWDPSILEGDGLAGDKDFSEEAPKMTTDDLLKILRSGAGALNKVDDEAEGAYEAWTKFSFEEIVAKGRERQDMAQAKIKMELGEEQSADETALAQRAIEQEKELLGGVEHVQSRLFKGEVHKPGNFKDIRREWEDQKRQRESRTVMINGHAISRETVGNTEWEAVKTLTSDPEMLKRLRSPKRERAKFEHEDHCIFCRDGGDLFVCSYCPRVAHAECTGHTEEEMAKTITWTCPQHSCSSCSRNTSEAGGMLLRCQTCPNAFCEDCLPDSDADLHIIGDNLPEFSELGYQSKGGYYIRCWECAEHFKTDPDLEERWFGGKK